MAMLHQRREPFLLASRNTQPHEGQVFSRASCDEVSSATAASTIRRRSVQARAARASTSRTSRPPERRKCATRAASAHSRLSAVRSAGRGRRPTTDARKTRSKRLRSSRRRRNSTPGFMAANRRPSPDDKAPTAIPKRSAAAKSGMWSCGCAVVQSSTVLTKSSATCPATRWNAGELAMSAM